MRPNFHDRGYFPITMNRVVNRQDLIGLFDMDSTTVGRDTRQFLAAAEKKGELESHFSDLPVTFIVCSTPACKNRVLLTGFSLSTLTGRLLRPLHKADSSGNS